MPQIQIRDRRTTVNGKEYITKNERFLVLSWHEGEWTEQEEILKELGSKQVLPFIMQSILEKTLIEYFQTQNTQVLKMLETMLQNGVMSSSVPDVVTTKTNESMEDVFTQL